jgi:hypothetical protein
MHLLVQLSMRLLHRHSSAMITSMSEACIAQAGGYHSLGSVKRNEITGTGFPYMAQDQIPTYPRVAHRCHEPRLLPV